MECGKHPEPEIEGRRPRNKEARQWAGKTQHTQMCRTRDRHRDAIPGTLPRAQDGCPCGPALITASPHGACQLSGSASSGFSEQQPGFSLSFEPSCHRPRGSGEDTWQRDNAQSTRLCSLGSAVSPAAVDSTPCGPSLRGYPLSAGALLYVSLCPHPETLQ